VLFHFAIASFDGPPFGNNAANAAVGSAMSRPARLAMAVGVVNPFEHWSRSKSGNHGRSGGTAMKRCLPASEGVPTRIRSGQSCIFSDTSDSRVHREAR